MFENARIKLTLWYLLIIMLVSGFFSLIVYRGFTKELGRGFRFQSLHAATNPRIIVQERNGFFRMLPFLIYPDEIPPEEFAEIINLAKHRFAMQLALINGGILIMAGCAGYFLAGKTLYPIERMVNGQKRFVADASHELRTPITAMKTEVEVALRNKKLKLNDAKDLLKSNLVEIDKIKDFTDYLLTLSRLETNGQDYTMELVDLSEAAKQAVDKNKILAKNKQVEILTSYSDVLVRGNTQSLIDLISVLVNNAIKYSPPKTTIKIATGKDKRHATLQVSDQGVGIDKKDIPYIFDRFYRSDASRSKVIADGYGLGLSIAKSVAEIHNADIKVESRLNKGSKFTVTFPKT